MITYKATATEIGVPVNYQVLVAKTREQLEKIVSGMGWSYQIEEVERLEVKSPFILFCEANNLNPAKFSSKQQFQQCK